MKLINPYLKVICWIVAIWVGFMRFFLGFSQYNFTFYYFTGLPASKSDVIQKASLLSKHFPNTNGKTFKKGTATTGFVWNFLKNSPEHC